MTRYVNLLTFHPLYIIDNVTYTLGHIYVNLSICFHLCIIDNMLDIHEAYICYEHFVGGDLVPGLVLISYQYVNLSPSLQSGHIIVGDLCPITHQYVNLSPSLHSSHQLWNLPYPENGGLDNRGCTVYCASCLKGPILVSID